MNKTEWYEAQARRFGLACLAVTYEMPNVARLRVAGKQKAWKALVAHLRANRPTGITVQTEYAGNQGAIPATHVRKQAALAPAMKLASDCGICGAILSCEQERGWRCLQCDPMYAGRPGRV